MLQLIDVCKSYPIHHGRSMRQVLDHVNLTIRPGEKWGIMGRNGAGKSTMIRIMSGSDRPHSGVVRKDMSVSWPLAFGDAFQGSLTGKDNARLISRVYGVDYHKTLELVESFAELGPYLGEPVKSYSSGMRARLAFGLTLAVDFECFLIDEVISVGDSRFQQKCYDALFVRRKHCAMILVSHDANIIKTYCNKALVLKSGRGRVIEDLDFALEIYHTL